MSATKVPPWKRKSLGEWLNNRAPEFDALLFWKLDRFIRRMTDLSTMIEWCERYGKNLVSKNDAIDLGTTVGRIMVTLIGGIAEIEAANTSTRVASLWDYTRTQDAWLVGKPAYGYVTTKISGKPALAIDPDSEKALHWARRMALRGVSARRMVRCILRAGLMSAGLTPSTLLRRLRNPALMGYRSRRTSRAGSGGAGSFSATTASRYGSLPRSSPQRSSRPFRRHSTAEGRTSPPGKRAELPSSSVC